MNYNIQISKILELTNQYKWA